MNSLQAEGSADIDGSRISGWNFGHLSNFRSSCFPRILGVSPGFLLFRTLLLNCPNILKKYIHVINYKSIVIGFL